MKYLSSLFLLFSFCAFAQSINVPEISEESGFYTEDFNVEITHSDPSLKILYTLDGSDPRVENLNGKSWSYKQNYPYAPGVPFGDLLNDNMWTYEYESPISVYNRTSDETVLKNVNTSIFSTNSFASGELFKGFVIRACAYNESTQEYSDVITRNYFISNEGDARYSMPVVALSMDNDRLYSYETGINVPGVLYDNWRNDNPDQGWDIFADANYHLSGSDTEFEINFNYFENGQEILNHNAGIRINGGATRYYPNKSFRLYAKSGYGEKNFKHAFFEGYPINKFKRLILRNSGNDAAASFFRDSFMHDLARNLNFEIQESLGVVLFINGEYNGIRNLRERYDSKYFDSIYGIDEDELDFLENFLEVKEGDDIFFNQMMDYFKANSLESEANYNQAITYMDPINFTDFYITYIYVANDDWPHNNNLLWRKKTEYNPEQQGPADGRFRWLLKDLDRGFFLNQVSGNSYQANTLDWATRVISEGSDPYYGELNQPTLQIRRLLENDNYKHYFINRFADLLNTTFVENRVVDKIEKYENIYAPEIEENGRRWNNFTIKPNDWVNDVSRMKDFANNRPQYQRQHIIDKFNLDGEIELEVDVSDEEHGFVSLNTIDLTPETDGIDEIVYPWNGIYFKNVPVKLTAIPNEGYQFSHWSGDSNSTDSEITISLNQNSSIKAYFISDSLNTNDPVFATKQLEIYPNPTSETLFVITGEKFNKPNYWITDLTGRTIQSGTLNNNRLDVKSLSKGIYFIRFEENGNAETKRFIKSDNAK